MYRGNVFLVGPMGAGKSTLGRQLAIQLGCSFLDSDTEIMSRSGADIPWIFDVEGEDGFRRREAQVVDDVTKLQSIVLATGGGAVLKSENRLNLSARGQVIYLETSVDNQLARTGKDKNRPLLQSEDPRQTLTNLLAVRDPLYREVADHIVSTNSGNVKETIAKIMACLETVAQ